MTITEKAEAIQAVIAEAAEVANEEFPGEAQAQFGCMVGYLAGQLVGARREVDELTKQLSRVPWTY